MSDQLERIIVCGTERDVLTGICSAFASLNGARHRTPDCRHDHIMDMRVHLCSCRRTRPQELG
jgi:hypothetical protein